MGLNLVLDSSWNAWHSSYFRSSIWEIQLKSLLNGLSELDGCPRDKNDIEKHLIQYI